MKIAKSTILSVVANGLEDKDDEDAARGKGLTDENELILAQNMITINSKRLIDNMKAATERYNVNIANMTEDLMRSLFLQIGGGDDLMLD